MDLSPAHIAPTTMDVVPGVTVDGWEWWASGNGFTVRHFTRDQGKVLYWREYEDGNEVGVELVTETGVVVSRAGGAYPHAPAVQDEVSRRWTMKCDPCGYTVDALYEHDAQASLDTHNCRPSQ